MDDATAEPEHSGEQVIATIISLLGSGVEIAQLAGSLTGAIGRLAESLMKTGSVPASDPLRREVADEMAVLVCRVAVLANQLRIRLDPDMLKTAEASDGPAATD